MAIMSKHKSKPSVSVIILSYNNYNYLYEALDSLIEQDYPNIELILSNDGSTDFDEKAVTAYLGKHKTKKLKKFSIINNKTNLGTVKSLNNAIRLARGKFLLFFAADDAFYDSQVISRFIQTFEKLPPDALIVTAQLGMYDIFLKKLIKLFVRKNDIKLLKEAEPDKLFAEMSTRCIIAAASTCYKTSLFKKFGLFDERYKLIEDWSSALRFVRIGLNFHYKNFIAFKHRDGGVSHGNVKGEQRLSKQYDLDLLNIMKYEVLPYANKLTADQKKKFLAFYLNHKWRYEYNYAFKNSQKSRRRFFVKNNWQLMLKGNLLDLREYFVDQLEGKKFKLLLFGILFSILPLSSNTLSYLGRVIIFSVLLLTSYQLYKIYFPRLVKLIKFIA
jgi:glycosyltransferase involved in cell wall biosynthesis